jgi:methyl-accepting chemotaxis protein
MGWWQRIRNDKRKKKIVDFFLQLRISIDILVLSAFFLVLIAFLVYVPPFATLFSSKPLEIHQHALTWLIDINLAKWPLMILLVTFWVFVIILFSHRIVGPYYKLLIMFRKYGARDFRHRTSLREKDFFLPLVPLINKVIDNTNEDGKAIRKNIEELEAAINKLDSSQKDHLLELVGKLKFNNASYQFKDSE